MSQMLLTGAGGATNILASVPWVAQWKFNNNGNDSIGANNLTNNNSATFTTGLLGGATGATHVESGSNQYWSIVSNAALSMGDVDFTLAGWFNFDFASLETYRMLVTKWTEPNTREYALYYNWPANKLYFSVSDTGSNEVSAVATLPNPPLAETWYCIYGWHDSVANTINIQVNNGTVYSTAHAAGVASVGAALNLGAYSNGSLPHDGLLENVCIAKSAAGGGGVLTAAQRTAFYNAGVGTETIT